MSLINIKTLKDKVLDSDPDLLSISAFSELVEEYGKTKADNIIKAHYVWLDPAWSKRKHFSEKKRKEEAEKNFLKKASVTWEDVADFTSFYKNHCLTDLERELESMERLVEERSQYFHKLSYSEDQKTKDSMAKSHPEFVKKVKELRDLVSEEKGGKTMRGNYQKSFAEKQSGARR